jgi:hypothetical protein
MPDDSIAKRPFLRSRFLSKQVLDCTSQYHRMERLYDGARPIRQCPYEADVAGFGFDSPWSTCWLAYM